MYGLLSEGSQDCGLSAIGSQWNCPAGPGEEWFYIEAVGSISPCTIELYLKAEGLFWPPGFGWPPLVEVSQILAELLGILEEWQPAKKHCLYSFWELKDFKMFLLVQVFHLITSFLMRGFADFLWTHLKTGLSFSSIPWTSKAFSWCLGLGKSFLISSCCRMPSLEWVCFGMGVLQISWWELQWWLSNKWLETLPNFSAEQNTNPL